MLKNILGAIVFTAAVFALVNFIGDAMVNPSVAPQSQAVLKAKPAAPAETQAEAPAEVAARVEEAQEEAEEEAENAVETAVASAMGDADDGKKTFRKKCMGCHTIGKGEANRTGPNLWGIVDHAKGASEGFRYSKSLLAIGGTWNEADLMAFIAGPRNFLPDTKMTFAGLKKEKDRANIIAYLKTLKD